MKTNSKQIGNRFERQIALFLSLKISDGERTDLFARTPASGVCGKRSDKFKGDIMLVDTTGEYKWFDFVVECKTSKRGSIIPLRSSVKQYIRCCEKQYKRDMKWMLITQFREIGNSNIYAIVPIEFTYYLRGNVVCYLNNNGKEYFVYDFYTMEIIEEKFIN